MGLHLLREGAVHALASDAHSLRRRPFCLADGRAAAAEVVGAEAADRLAVENPWAIARGEPIDAEPPTLHPVGAARRLIRRIPGFGP